jgi:hypothetical protein
VYFTLFFFISSINPTQSALVTTVVHSCEPTDSGVNIAINTNGFEPNTRVKSKLEEKRTSYIPASGDYQTNVTGGFHDIVFVKGLSDGEYKVFFGETMYQCFKDSPKPLDQN